MNNTKKVYEWLEHTFLNIPSKMKISILASFAFGLIGHMFCFTNTLFLHDAAGIYWNPVSFAEAASGSRWLYPIYDWFLGGVQLPWLDGAITLLLYGVSAWIVCEVLNIEQKISVIFISGLMVLSPTAIASNCYLSSAPIYASALLFSCLAVYAFFYWRYGAVWFFTFAILCEGSYAAYIGFSICLFFLKMFVVLLDAEKEDGVKLLKDHFLVLICIITSLLATFGLMKLLQLGSSSTLQHRISVATSSGIATYLDNIYRTIYTVARTFLPGGSISYMQQRPVTYVIFLLGIAGACIMYFMVFKNKKMWKKGLCCFLLIADVMLLPFAMNFFRLITDAHTLMQFGFIAPWIFCLLIHEYITQSDIAIIEKKLWITNGYSWLVVLVSVTSIYNYCILANTAYAKEAVLYETSTSLVNRIVEKIESDENYQQGETPVVFIGDTREHYAPYHEGFSICDSITGIGSEWWDTSLTYNFPLIMYIQQHLGIEMKILNVPGETGINANQLQIIVNENGAEIGIEELNSKIASIKSFPSDECIEYIGNVLVFKLSD